MLKPCLDCGALTEHERCEQHRKAKKRSESKRRGSSTERGYDARHRRRRKRYLKLFPICQHPGCTEPSTDLDHIDGNPNNNAWVNYRALCHPHHSQRTARDQPGGWNQRS